MAYATVQDMLSRYGQIEMIRLSVLDGDPLDAINVENICRALNEASAMIDSYARRRYLTPVATVPVPPELNRACCVMARYDLYFGNQKEPTEQVRLQWKQIIEWLEGIRDGKILLADATPAGEQSFAMVKDRGFTTFADDGDNTGANTFAPQGSDLPPGAQYGGTDWSGGFA